MVSDVDGDGGGGLTSPSWTSKCYQRTLQKNVEHPNGWFFKNKSPGSLYWCFQKQGYPMDTPKWMVCNGKPYMDDLGVPLFSETPILQATWNQPLFLLFSSTFLLADSIRKGSISERQPCPEFRQLNHVPRGFGFSQEKLINGTIYQPTNQPLCLEEGIFGLQFPKCVVTSYFD